MSLDINYTWNFNPLEAYPTASGEANVVFNVHWQLYGSTGSYQASVIGVQPVTYETGSLFVPFNELTYDIVYNWMTASMGLEQMQSYEANVAQKLENQINPPVLIEQAPWLNNNVVINNPE
jgi:hypothetical protein